MAQAAYDWTPQIIKTYEVLCVALLIYLSFRAETKPICLAFVLASLGLLLFSRWQEIQINMVMNPDEAEMIAAAKKFAIDFMPWRSVTTSSSGPLNAMSLMWPLLFRGNVTFATARLTAVLCMGVTWIFVFLSLVRSTPAFRVIVSGLLMLFLAGTNWFDFVNFSSENVPTALLAAASWCAIEIMHGDRRIWRLLLAGLLLGAVPFAKLQAVPIAATIGLFQLAPLLIETTDLKVKFRRCAFLLVGAVAPLILILTPLALAGGFPDFWISYIEWGLAYSTLVTPFEQLLRLAWTDQPLAWYIVGTSTLVVQAILLRLITSLRFRSSQYNRIEGLGILFCFAALFVSIYAVMKPGRPATHYLLLPVPFLALLAGSLWPKRLLTSKRLPSVALVGLAIVLRIVFGSNGLHPTPRWPGTLSCLICSPEYSIVQPESIFNAGDVYSWLPKGTGRLEVWGWQPELHVYSGMAPATRDTSSNNQLTDGAFRTYFRARFIGDFDKSPPALVIDAPAPGSFAFRTPDSSFTRVFPELAIRVRNRYTLVSTADEDCPRAYIRNDLYARLPYIHPTGISASSYFDIDGLTFPPAFVDDYKTTETCRDFWLLPDSKTGDITLTFEPEHVKSVWLLNTRNSIGNRQTKQAKVDLLLRGAVVKSINLEVRRYPYWTIIPVENQEADALRVTIVTFDGIGGGLNEVKMERSDR